MASEALIKAVEQQQTLDRLSDQLQPLVFNVREGSVVDGPATFPQPRFETRVREGQIEVRSVDS